MILPPLCTARRRRRRGDRAGGSPPIGLPSNIIIITHRYKRRGIDGGCAVVGAPATAVIFR